MARLSAHMRLWFAALVDRLRNGALNNVLVRRATLVSLAGLLSASILLGGDASRNPASAQPRPVPSGPFLPGPSLPTQFQESAQCGAGPNGIDQMPRWSEVVANNKAYLQSPPAATSATGADVVGVPNLDNPAGQHPNGNLEVSNSLLNLTALLSNIISFFEEPGQITSSAGDLGVGVCTNNAGRGMVVFDVEYCGYEDSNTGHCASYDTAYGNKLFWIPKDLKVFHKLESLGVAAGMQSGQTFTLGAADPEKWPWKLSKVLDLWNNGTLNSTINDVVTPLSEIKSEIEDFRQWWDDFTNQINRYAEGYHLGAYDETRPDLHFCVGYYGHDARADFLDLFDGKVSMGSKYSSFNISEKHRVQARLGGMHLTVFGKTLDLLPTPEINFQTEGLKPWDCGRPFGMDLNLCSISVQLPVAQCSGVNYLSSANLGGGNGSDASLGVMTDYYPLSFAGNVVKWPRSVAGQSFPNFLLDGELPSAAVMDAGLNLGFDFGLKDPTPRILPPPIQLGPIQGVLKWDLDYGTRWVHDSNLLMEKIRDALTENQSAIDVADIVERDMHPLQADDLTADNGQELYIKPSLLLGLGYALVKKAWRLIITVDLGLHVDVEPGFYGGIADMNVALKEALEAAGANENQECNPVYSEKTVANTCSADSFMFENDPLDAGWESAMAEEDVTAPDIYYYCGDKSKLEGVSGSGLKSCESYGYCIVEFEGQTRRMHNLTAAGCKERGGVFEAYSCNEIKKAEITGWEGPGCSPLLDGAGFPSAPGGACQAPGTSLPARSITPRAVPSGSRPKAERAAYSSAASAVCGAGYTCNDGACLKTCTTDSQCGSGSKCDVAEGVCVHAGGLPFVEQIAWRADHPAPGEPQHSVWSYAANKLEALLQFSLGYDLQLWVKIFGKERRLVKQQDSKHWPLLPPLGMFEHKFGLVADYNHSCAPAGAVEKHSDQEGTNLPRARANNWITDGVTTSEQLIEECMAKAPQDIVDDSILPTPPDEGEVKKDLTELYQFSETLALDYWQEYHDNMCINGVPVTEWYAAMVTNDSTDIPISMSGGQSTSTQSTHFERQIAKASGCLDADRPFAAQIATVTGIENGRVDIYSWLIDPNGDVEFRPPNTNDDNVSPAVRGHILFLPWYAGVNQCLDSYFASGAVSLDFEPTPCDEKPAGQCKAPPSRGMTFWAQFDSSLSADTMHPGAGAYSSTVYAGVTQNNDVPSGHSGKSAKLGDAPARILFFPTASAGAPFGFGTGDLSLDAWVKHPNHGGVSTLLDTRKVVSRGETRGVALFLSNGKLGFQMFDGASHTNWVSGTTVAGDQWRHVTVTVDRDQANGGKIYVDGQVVHTFDPRSRSGSLSASSLGVVNPLAIGHDLATDNFGAAFLIDEVELFNRVLSPPEIRILAESPKCKDQKPGQSTAVIRNLPFGGGRDAPPCPPLGVVYMRTNLPPLATEFLASFDQQCAARGPGLKMQSVEYLSCRAAGRNMGHEGAVNLTCG